MLTCRPYPLSTDPARVSRTMSAWLLAVVCSAALTGCVSTEVRRVDMTPPQQTAVLQDEQQLLDVGIAVFDANVPESYDEQVKLLVQPEIRRAEANYFPYFAKNLLESTGNWGAVRVVPLPTHAVDVMVSGTVLHSNGESLALAVEVVDATGRRWLSKKYAGLASRYAYEPTIPRNIDPFQAIYKALADDMLAFRETLTQAQIDEIRATAELQFARAFAPEAFSGYLREDRRGSVELIRLPAADDPMLARVRRIRDREYLFIDTLDEYYANYDRAVFPSYHAWRKATYDEAIAYKELRAQSRARAIGGGIAMVGGVAAMVEGDSWETNVGGLISVIGGAVMMRSAITKRAEASMHGEALQEVGVAAEAELMPHTIELENQIVRLHGTVDEQYQALRQILRDLYFEDLDLPPPPAASP
jgi:hypothetical protein